MRYALIALLIATPAAAEVRDADEKMVEGCQFVGMVDGSGGTMTGKTHKAAKDARADARREAESMGGTHVVWFAPQTAGGGVLASGRAYRCQAGD